MMTEDQLIEVLQGMKVGRKWGVRYKHSDSLIEQENQGISPLCWLLTLKGVERIELMPLPTEITFNGVMIPAPLRVAPEIDTAYYVPQPYGREYQSRSYWWNDAADRFLLERGLVHLTAEAAARHGKAMTV